MVMRAVSFAALVIGTASEGLHASTHKVVNGVDDVDPSVPRFDEARELLRTMAALRVDQEFRPDFYLAKEPDRGAELESLTASLYRAINRGGLEQNILTLLLSASESLEQKAELIIALRFWSLNRTMIARALSPHDREDLARIFGEIFSTTRVPWARGSTLTLIGDWYLAEGLPLLGAALKNRDDSQIYQTYAAQVLRRFETLAVPYVGDLIQLAFPNAKTEDRTSLRGMDGPEEAGLSLLRIGEAMVRDLKDSTGLEVITRVLKERPPLRTAEGSDSEWFLKTVSFNARWSRALKLALESSMPETYDYFLPEILKIFREGPFYLSAHFQSHLVTDGWGADADTLVVHFLGDYGGEVLPQIQSSIKRRWMESGESQRRRLIDLVSNLGVEARSLAPFFIRQIKDQSLGDIGPWEVEILLSKIGGAEAAAYFASLNSRSSRWPNAGHSQQSDIEIYRRTVNHIAVLEDSDSSPASKREALQYFAGDYRFKNAQFIVGPLSQIALDPSTPADLKSAAIRLIAGTRGKPFEIFFEQWIARFDGSKQDLELLDFLLNKEVDRRSS